MTTSAGSQAIAGPQLLGPRITRRLLDRLACRAVTVGPRELLPVGMPATGTILGHVPRGTADDVAAAAETARRAQRDWRRLPATQRSQVLLRFATLLLGRQGEVLDLIQLENGKARRHAFEEVIDVAQVCRYYARTAPRYLRPHRRAGALPVLTQTWEYHHPKGVVGVISPWNYPLTLGISDALPALAAGNAVITKPDSQTPYTALWAAELLEEAGLPPGVLQVVTGSGQELGTPVI
ncbi:MAG TPA: aldehyde dehydrogenase family protein, partial [Streptosporangiaceae bacterium]|nr:aldehyde dehydrogenase family protein [Streptosporangiaceae bacterium]